MAWWILRRVSVSWLGLRKAASGRSWRIFPIRSSLLPSSHRAGISTFLPESAPSLYLKTPRYWVWDFSLALNFIGFLPSLGRPAMVRVDPLLAEENGVANPAGRVHVGTGLVDGQKRPAFPAPLLAGRFLGPTLAVSSAVDTLDKALPVGWHLKSAGYDERLPCRDVSEPLSAYRSESRDLHIGCLVPIHAVISSLDNPPKPTSGSSARDCASCGQSPQSTPKRESERRGN